MASWERIWNDPGNAALRELRGSPENIREGDVLEIPEPVLGEVSRPTEVRHPFVRVGVPPATIRIIDDGGNPTIAVARQQRVLQVSTFVTTRQLPTGFLTASTDRRNFKIEVFDDGATGQTINCELEAMKPRLDARGRPERDADGHLTYESFAPRRVIAGLQLRRVPGLANIYRSRYLRLVTDNEDDAARANQTLLADHDPNDLRVEILDQQVVARYTAVSGEPLATEAVIGDAELRVRCKVFVCRKVFGVADDLVGDVTLDDVRRHVLSWVRRTYAAANMSPLLVGTGVDQVDPVENLVGISGTGTRNARGGREIRFRVNSVPPTTVAITTVANETPRQIADRLAAEALRLLPAGFTADVTDNPMSITRVQSADIVIKNGANQVIIDNERSRDDRIRIRIGRVRPNSTNVATFNFSNVGEAGNRALIKNFRTNTPENQGSLAVFVIGRFSAAAGAVGFAYGRQFRERPEFQGTFPVAGSCFVEARTTSRADRRVHTTDHEMGHILIDMVHFAGFNTELMTDAPVNLRNSVNDSKRLSDRVIPYREFVRGANRSFPINPNSEIRTRERRFIEGWDDLFRRP